MQAAGILPSPRPRTLHRSVLEVLAAPACGGLAASRRGPCHSKRAVLWAEWLSSGVLAAVPHHQWVFTLPKRLRLLFLYDRRLLGVLSRCAWRTVRDLYRVGFQDRQAVPGMVVSIRTCGDLANWQPDLHALVSAGVFGGEGVFTPLALPPAGVAEELFRRRGEPFPARRRADRPGTVAARASA